MGAFAVGDIVLCRFPQTDQKEGKIRPTVVVAELSRNDLILCFITSVPPAIGSPHIEITDEQLRDGSLRQDPSFIHASKLLTLNERNVYRKVAALKQDTLKELMSTIRQVFTI